MIMHRGVVHTPEYIPVRNDFSPAGKFIIKKRCHCCDISFFDDNLSFPPVKPE